MNTQMRTVDPKEFYNIYKELQNKVDVVDKDTQHLMLLSLGFSTFWNADKVMEKDYLYILLNRYLHEPLTGELEEHTDQIKFFNVMSKYVDSGLDGTKILKFIYHIQNFYGKVEHKNDELVFTYFMLFCILISDLSPVFKEKFKSINCARYCLPNEYERIKNKPVDDYMFSVKDKNNFTENMLRSFIDSNVDIYKYYLSEYVTLYRRIVECNN